MYHSTPKPNSNSPEPEPFSPAPAKKSGRLRLHNTVEDPCYFNSVCFFQFSLEEIVAQKGMAFYKVNSELLQWISKWFYIFAILTLRATIFQNTFLAKQYNPFEQNHPPK